MTHAERRGNGAASGRVAGKVALVTGAARGQGRSHCRMLAAEGADIIAIDICTDLPTVPYWGATSTDLEETARLVEAEGRQIVTASADVRDLAQLQAAVTAGVDRLGRLDIVVANAGIINYGQLVELTEDQWQTVIDVNLTGVWKTIRAAVPSVIEADNGGSVVLIGSTGSLRGLPTVGHYVATKHGVLGLTRTLAIELAPHSIRVNALAPTNVTTDMLNNPGVFKMFRPDLATPTAEDAYPAFVDFHLMKQPAVEPVDVSNALLYLVSETGRYVTGTILPVDLGLLTK
ncbi:MAG: mycofactocin-coupled SDR family oxidoreductase [Nocardioidaceae bacterium]|nr:MAG: mycofactocin-coupled SDR family oxidoreductase [Nocardioidaceae bacterium]